MTTDPPPTSPSEPTEQVPELPRLQLREPLGSVIDAEDELVRACAEISLAHGPIALDAERASGYRYSQRAYLVQIRRTGAGTFLVDPTQFDDLLDLGDAFGDAEWILHAATQDLPCLREVGLQPAALFDTELAGRLLNLPRVGLASLVEHYLGLTLAKEFSAADWSTRPLPDPWLEYAALDVEVLVELRDLIERDLDRSDKLHWALEEFDALLSFSGPPERAEPWRRTSGIHKARGRRALAIVRSLWTERDRIAAARDVTPSRILSDSSIMTLAGDPPESVAALKQSRALRQAQSRKYLSEWFDAIEKALTLPEDELPASSNRNEGLPPPRAWADKKPEAAQRLTAAKEVINQLAETYNLPAENLITPVLIRQLAWEPPAVLDPVTVAEALQESGARSWQTQLVAEPLSAAFSTIA